MESLSGSTSGEPKESSSPLVPREAQEPPEGGPRTGVVLQEEASLMGMVLGEEALADPGEAMVLREEDGTLEEEGAAAMTQTTLQMVVTEIAPMARLRATMIHSPVTYVLP